KEVVRRPIRTVEAPGRERAVDAGAARAAARTRAAGSGSAATPPARDAAPIARRRRRPDGPARPARARGRLPAATGDRWDNRIADTSAPAARPGARGERRRCSHTASRIDDGIRWRTG